MIHLYFEAFGSSTTAISLDCSVVPLLNKGELCLEYGAGLLVAQNNYLREQILSKFNSVALLLL